MKIVPAQRAALWIALAIALSVLVSKGLASSNHLSISGAADRGAEGPVAVTIPLRDPLTVELALALAERKLFSDAADGNLDEIPLLDAALIACGIDDSSKLEECQRRFATVCDEIHQRTAGLLTAAAQMEIIHHVLHERLLAGGYDANATDLADTLRTGVYNCASATVLWIAAARELNLDAHAVEMPGHVRVEVRCDGELDEIEATCPRWREAVRSAPTFSPRAHTGHAPGGREISTAGVLAMIYYNRGIDAFNQHHYADAVALNRRALLLDAGNQTARGNLLASVNNWALALGDTGEFDAAESLLDCGRRFDPGHAAFAHNAMHLEHERAQLQRTFQKAPSNTK